MRVTVTIRREVLRVMARRAVGREEPGTNPALLLEIERAASAIANATAVRGSTPEIVIKE